MTRESGNGRAAGPLLSICIPSYNRPEQLHELLLSVDAAPESVEIVVCEDCAPGRRDVREAVRQFQANSPYTVHYHENEKNYGYDRNLRELIARASGEFVMFMGDDDQFVPGNLSRFLEFLVANPDLGYVLRSYSVVHDDGTPEMYRYFDQSRRFEAGSEAYVTLFRKSVTIAGFTFKRRCGLDYLTDRFDGTLLFQLYLMAEITLRHPSAYCDVPVALVSQTFRLDKPQFGASEAERRYFEPGRVTPRNSVNFMKGFFRITSYMDQQYGLQSTDRVRHDLSKYSYPILSIQRKHGAREFLGYLRLLNAEVGINITPYYYLYATGLLVLGERPCDRLIMAAKRLLGRTPQL